jgi:hypothetical protein
MIKHFVQQPNGGLIFPTGGFVNLHQKAIVKPRFAIGFLR